MNTDLLDEAIAKLVKAGGPDRVIDGLIFKAVEEKPGDVWSRDFADDIWHRQDPNDRIAYDSPPHYTASIDAAAGLITEDWAWSLHGGEGVCAGATLSRQNAADDPYMDDVEVSGNEPPYPVLCLCLAALRAMQADAVPAASPFGLGEEYCEQCHGPCMRRPRHGDGMNI